jgi:hypothetical protein
LQPKNQIRVRRRRGRQRGRCVRGVVVRTSAFLSSVSSFAFRKPHPTHGMDV